MIEIEKIINDLIELKKLPGLYIQPVEASILMTFLNGLGRGVLHCLPSLTFGDYVESRRHASLNRGWNSAFAVEPLRESGMSEADMIQELIEIEIERWKLLKKWLSEESICS